MASCFECGNKAAVMLHRYGAKASAKPVKKPRLLCCTSLTLTTTCVIAPAAVTASEKQLVHRRKSLAPLPWRSLSAIAARAGMSLEIAVLAAASAPRWRMAREESKHLARRAKCAYGARRSLPAGELVRPYGGIRPYRRRRAAIACHEAAHAFGASPSTA